MEPILTPTKDTIPDIVITDGTNDAITIQCKDITPNEELKEVTTNNLKMESQIIMPSIDTAEIYVPQTLKRKIKQITPEYTPTPTLTIGKLEENKSIPLSKKQKKIVKPLDNKTATQKSIPDEKLFRLIRHIWRLIVNHTNKKGTELNEVDIKWIKQMGIEIGFCGNFTEALLAIAKSLGLIKIRSDDTQEQRRERITLNFASLAAREKMSENPYPSQKNFNEAVLRECQDLEINSTNILIISYFCEQFSSGTLPRF